MTLASRAASPGDPARPPAEPLPTVGLPCSPRLRPALRWLSPSLAQPAAWGHSLGAGVPGASPGWGASSVQPS